MPDALPRRPRRTLVLAALAAGTAGFGAGPTLPTFTEELAARSITRLALTDLRLAQAPSTSDYRVAELLLGEAQRYMPDDQDVIRRRMEAAWAVGDKDTVIELSRKLVALDARDTVSQLRLITASIGQLQTSDERLARYERFLGPEGEGFDASVRSRLALDAALLLRESGDDRGFIDKLKLALSLDPTHKEAASLAASYASQRQVDRGKRLELLSNLLAADPIDWNVHFSIARELASEGVFDQAARFHRIGSRLQAASGAGSQERMIEGMLLAWHEQGPRVAVDGVNQGVLLERDKWYRLRQRLARDKKPVTDVPDPDKVKPTVPFAKILAIAGDALGDRIATESAVRTMSVVVDELVQTLVDPVKRPAGLAEADAQAQAAAFAAEVELTRLWTDCEVDAAAGDLAPDASSRADLVRAKPSLAGWLEMRRGDTLAGIAQLEALAQADPESRVGMGLGYEKLGRRDDAIREYQRVVAEAPLTLGGAWSGSRLKTLGVTTDAEQTATLRGIARAIPSWVDTMAFEDPPVVWLEARHVTGMPDAADRNMIQIRLTNKSHIPLALGPDRTINSRVMISTMLDAPDLAGLIRPEVFDLDRRLRLMPRETLVVNVWPDPGPGGWLVETQTGRSIRERWRLTQGFILDSNGVPRPGVMCAGAETDSVERRPLPEASLGPADLIAHFGGDAEHALGRLAVALRGKMIPPRPHPSLVMQGVPPGASEEYVRVAQAVATRYPALSPATRAMLVAVLPHAPLAPAMRPFDEAARAETDPRVLMIVLATRITSPADPALVAALQSEDAAVRDLAGLITERLNGTGRYYAHLTVDNVWPQLPTMPEAPQ